MPECGEDFLFTADELTAANINPRSFLATDYLNHFNEVMMLLEMLPDMPDMVDEVMDWRPKSYCDHFRDTGFAGAIIAIAAYMNAPLFIKIPFDQAVSEIEIAILEAQIELNRLKPDDLPALHTLVETTLTIVRPLLGRADGIIHGRGATTDIQSHNEAQADIDALFD